MSQLRSSASPIAIVGMSGRFPGARDLDAFWANVRAGVESLEPFTDEEMIAAGVDRAMLSRADWVKRGTVLEGADHVRRVVLRLLAARSADHRSAAASLSRDGVGSARERRLHRRARGYVDRRLRRLEHSDVHHDAAARRSGARGVRRRLPAHAGQRQGFSHDARVVQAGSARAKHGGPDGVLDVARRRASRRAVRCSAASATWRWPAASRSVFRSARAICIRRE